MHNCLVFKLAGKRCCSGFVIGTLRILILFSVISFMIRTTNFHYHFVDTLGGVEVDVWKLRRKHTNEDGYSTQIKFAKIQEAKKKKAQVTIIVIWIPIAIALYEESDLYQFRIPHYFSTALIEKQNPSFHLRHTIHSTCVCGSTFVILT